MKLSDCDSATFEYKYCKNSDNIIFYWKNDVGTIAEAVLYSNGLIEYYYDRNSQNAEVGISYDAPFNTERVPYLESIEKNYKLTYG